MTLPPQTRATIRGVGHYLPKRVVTNTELTKLVDTSDSWIKERSGIERRHFAAEGETTSQLAAQAARNALSNSGLDIKDIDAIIVATSTPDLTFPSVASMVQAKIGMDHGFAFDVQAVCAGFIYALTTANAMIVAGQAKRIMVIGAETFSRIMDWNDRTTCVLFGDGAGAMIIEASTGTGANSDRGILATDLRSDGQYRDILYVDGGVSTGTTGYLRMKGKEVFRHAIEKLASTAQTVLTKANLSPDDVNWVIPHQANIRIIERTAYKMKINLERVIITVQDHGNTSAASIPLAFSVAAEQGKLKQGDLIVTEAIGGGLVWGSALLRW